jgi:hypothetical protein
MMFLRHELPEQNVPSYASHVLLPVKVLRVVRFPSDTLSHKCLVA